MEQQIPMALQVALYAASFVIVLAGLVLVGAVVKFHKPLERLVGAVEELRVEVSPLARETRAVVRGIGALSGRAHEQWTAVEGIVGKARQWSERGDQLLQEIGTSAQPFAFGAKRGFDLLRRTLATFTRAAPERERTRSAGAAAGATRPEAPPSFSSAASASTESEEIMSDIHQGNGKDILIAAVLGAAVGAGVALLLAPCSGQQTRGWLADRGRKLKDTTASALEQGKQSVRRAAHELGNTSREAADLLDRVADGEAELAKPRA